MSSDMLSNWRVTDINLEMLSAHNGPYLQRHGAELQELDALQVWREPFAQSACVVICAMLYPSGDLVQEFGRLLKAYNKRDSMQPRFQSIVVESLQAQMPHSTIVSISRQTDPLIPGQSFAVVGRMRPVLGYVPKRSSRGPGELQELWYNEDFHVRVTMQGPLQGSHFLDHSDNFFDLQELVFEAWQQDILTVFVGEWDGSLSASIARGLAHRVPAHRIARTMPNEFIFHGRPLGKGGKGKGKDKDRGDIPGEPWRAFKGYVGPYSGFLGYASDKWCESALRHLATHLAAQQQYVADMTWHEHFVNNHDMMSGVNAAVMWYFARPVNKLSVGDDTMSDDTARN